MVLSLVDLSLISITNGLKDGNIQHPQLLPPKLRQSVLDTALKRGLVNDQKCLEVLSSVEFLSGMNSFSTDAGRFYDVAFLDRVIRSLATISPNGETIGAAITKLSLNVFGCCYKLGAHSSNKHRVKSSFPTALRLISSCPNTVSLDLRGVGSDGQFMQRDGRRVFFHQCLPSILNEYDACKRVMENLAELSISGRWTKVLGSGSPIINFKQLTTLKLDGCSVQVDVWPNFLRKVPTLENLHMIDVIGLEEDDEEEGEYAEANPTDLDWILPFPMPHLKSMEVISVKDRFLSECNKAFVDNLVGCPNLREVTLMLDKKSIDEASLVRLASMDIALTMKARLCLTRNRAAELTALDSSSRCKIASIFHDKMDSFELLVWKEWSPRVTTALENVINTCSNLKTFRLLLPPGKIKSLEEAKKVNTALVQFFTNQDRALQLRSLGLTGSFDDSVLSAVFGNCLNLFQLKISRCSDLRDQHLIDWVAGGGGILTDLSITYCRNVTSEGIIPILARSPEGLLRVHVCSLDAVWPPRWETVLPTLCPYAAEVNIVS